MDDLISRQAAIDEIDEWIKAFQENGHKESAADACLIQDGIIQLPSAQPERKRGKWIRLDKGNTYFVPHMLQCSVCGNILDKHGVNAGRGDANYCPNCGSYNGGGDDEAD